MTQESAQKSPRVLIVEDSEDILALEKMIFSKEGADVVGLKDAESALLSVKASLQEQRPFDMIVLDIRLPVVNGYDLAKQIRELGYKGMIAAVTANATMEGKAEGMSSGIDLYFSKSVLKKDLVRALLQQATT